MKIAHVETQDQYALCLEIRKTVFIEEQRVPSDREIDPLKGENFLLFVGDEPVATGRYWIKDKNAKFERIAVLQKARGQGLGRALMEAMEHDAQTRYPNHQLILEAQESAIPFYEKLGWTAVGETFLDAGIVHQKMIK